ncbi:MAG TPA: hydantoinase B/oxoprolinase family protein, partial [Sphingomonadales bacterium]
YGVVVSADGVVDQAATEKLRAEMRSQRKGDLPIFNFGPSIEELRARCLEETGLPAPQPPVWRRHNSAAVA